MGFLKVVRVNGVWEVVFEVEGGKWGLGVG